MSATEKKITRALISVSDKTRLEELGSGLEKSGVEILSTGGSAKYLEEAGVAVTEIAEYTGFPEMMDGRLKTLHPKIHGGILARRDEHSHLEAMEEHGIGAIDLVVINLYPFEETVRSGASFEDCIEQIDIGGPALIRAAAKNHRDVAVVVDPADYDTLLNDMDKHDGAASAALRQRLAAKAFARTAAYDSAIAAWFRDRQNDSLPEYLCLSGRRKMTLRYGENPHQQAAFYVTGADNPGVATAEQLQGKELSYNNINDADAAFELVSEFDPADGPAVAIIKHANPCGVAQAKTLAEAYRRAKACDPVSAFGGVVALNEPLDGETAQEIGAVFTEVVIAPEIDEAARGLLAGKKNLRVLITHGLADSGREQLMLRSVAGGFLMQQRDGGRITADGLKIVTKKQPSQTQLVDLLFAFKVCKHVKSNAIVYAKDGATVGIGAGQMSRVDSATIAALKARNAAESAGLPAPLTEGCVVASDAFFPFADGLLAAAAAGATAVIQPGGSMRDEEVIAAADEAGLAMVFTGMRHFRH